LKTLYFDDLIEAKHAAKAERRVLDKTLRELRRVAKDFKGIDRKLRSRPLEREELRYAVEASILGAEKGLAGLEYLRWRETGGKPRKSLATELGRIERAQRRLKGELRRLWLARNRPEDFAKMASLYDASLRGLRAAARQLRRASSARGRRSL
jgi:hypothetical protein